MNKREFVLKGLLGFATFIVGLILILYVELLLNLDPYIGIVLVAYSGKSIY